MTKRRVGSSASGTVAGALLVVLTAAPVAAQQRVEIGPAIEAAIRKAVVLPAPSSAAPARAATSSAGSQAQAGSDNPVLKFFDRTELTGFVDTYYAYNFNSPSSPCGVLGDVEAFNCLHNFDFTRNGFALNLAELALEKKPTMDSRGGFRVDLDFGPTTAWVHGGDPGGIEVFQHVQQAYLSYLAPTSNGTLQIDFGKFVTQHGAEVIETKDNWNYTRSLLFTLAIPYYHMGVRALYSPNDRVTIGANISNGWNNVVDNNTGKTGGFVAIFKPTAEVTWTTNYMIGPEQTDNNDDFRHLFDTTIAYTASPQLSLMLNYDYGHDTVDGTGITWQGVGGYAKYQPNSWFALIPRYEYLWDGDGFMGVGQNVQEFTLTAELKHKDGVMMRIEYRGDVTQDPFFPKNSADVSKSQHVFVIGWVYSFSSKSP